jgi:hypothetical protein
VARSPKRTVDDGFYNKGVYKQRDKYGSKELKILENKSSAGGDMVNLPKRSADTSETWNAVLVAPFGAYLKLWATEIKMDFSLSGTVGQSRYRRQFFPRSFNQPVVTVSGRMPNQKEYNRLAAFVRECHFEAVTGNQDLYDNKERFDAKSSKKIKKGRKNSSASLQTITLMIKDAGALNRKGAPRNTKGGHKPIILDGYILNISAGAVKFDFAPDFQFEFLPAQSRMNANVGIYEDQMDYGSDLASWMDIFKTIAPQQRNKVITSNAGGSSTNNNPVTVSQPSSNVENKDPNKSARNLGKRPAVRGPWHPTSSTK